MKDAGENVAEWKWVLMGTNKHQTTLNLIMETIRRKKITSPATTTVLKQLCKTNSGTNMDEISSEQKKIEKRILK